MDNDTPTTNTTRLKPACRAFARVVSSFIACSPPSRGGAIAFVATVRVPMYLRNILTKPVKKMKEQTIHTHGRIKSAICKTFHVSETEIDSRSRVYRVAEARHAYVALLRELTQWPVARIARHIHRNDHGTVCNSIQRNADLCEIDWRYGQRVARARFLAGGAEQ